MGVEHKIRPLIGHLIDLIELINYRGQISNFAHNGQKFEFEGKRKDTSLVIMRSFQYFSEHRRQR